MPLSGFSAGGESQPPLVMGTTRLAGNICYEDIFGNELRRTAASATLLANVSNMAWFAGSWAAEQHLQMARARALETGRWMIRSTNTGATAIIDHQGKIRARLAEGARGILEGSAQNREGATPYMHWGDTPAIGLMGCLLILLLASARKKPSRC
jgi:apolipoprotein N-acyltransferase